MPTEQRSIIFTRDELAAAVRSYEPENGGGLPAGEVIFCRLNSGPGISVSVKILSEESSEMVSMELEPEFIGAALMHYCQSQNIPMPRRAEKSIQNFGEAIALTLYVDLSSTALPSYVKV